MAVLYDRFLELQKRIDKASDFGGELVEFILEDVPGTGVNTPALTLDEDVVLEFFTNLEKEYTEFELFKGLEYYITDKCDELYGLLALHNQRDEYEFQSDKNRRFDNEDLLPLLNSKYDELEKKDSDSFRNYLFRLYKQKLEADFPIRENQKFIWEQVLDNWADRSLTGFFLKGINDGFLESQEWFIDAVKVELSTFQGIKSKSPESLSSLSFEGNSAAEKLVVLVELGIIDYLRNKYKGIPTNALSQLLSMFTGESKGTIQGALNPYIGSLLNNDIHQKNNPVSEKNLEKVRSNLSRIGLYPLD